MIDDQNVEINSQLEATMGELYQFVTERKLVPELAVIWQCSQKTVYNRFQRKNLTAIEMCQMGQLEPIRPLMAMLLRQMAVRFEPSTGPSPRDLWVLEYRYKLIKAKPAMDLLSKVVAAIRQVQGLASNLFYSADDRVAVVRIKTNQEPLPIDPFDDFFDWRYTLPPTIIGQIDQALIKETGMAIKKWFEELIKVVAFDGYPSKIRRVHPEELGRWGTQKMPLFESQPQAGGTGGQ